MEGLTAKVFRTYNASITLQEQLLELTKGSILMYFTCTFTCINVIHNDNICGDFGYVISIVLCHVFLV